MSYLNFQELPNLGKKTKVWNVYSKNSPSSDGPLGSVEWRPTWRKYVFGPSGGTVYDPACLREISDFMESQTTEHKERLRSLAQVIKEQI